MNRIQILGAAGSRTQDEKSTCLRIAHDTLIDAGSILEPLGEEACHIEHIFLTHAHFDHIADLVPLVDAHFADRNRTLHLYGLAETLMSIQSHLFNGIIYPNFDEIPLKNGASDRVIAYHPIQTDKPHRHGDITLTPFATQHTIPSCGYVIQRETHAIAFTSDTQYDETLPTRLAAYPNLHTLIIELSYASRHHDLAIRSGHMTPTMLHDLLNRFSDPSLRVLALHLKSEDRTAIESEVNALFHDQVTLLQSGSIVPYSPHEAIENPRAKTWHYDLLIETGIALTHERDPNRLYDQILYNARALTHSDAGTLYVLDKKKGVLLFQSIQNDTLDTRISGTKIHEIWSPLPLYQEDGTPNNSLLSVRCALTRTAIKVDDVYQASSGMDFSATQRYDAQSGYRSRSMLLVPLLDHHGETRGVLQLINKHHSVDGFIPYASEDERIIQALGAQAAVAMNNQKLIADLEHLFESFLNAITLALDKKSKHTGGHIRKMVDLTMMIVDAIEADDEHFSSVHFTPQERKTIKLAAMMHDIGKITTPTHIVDKATKLETITDRIELIRWRLNALKAQAQSSHPTESLNKDTIEEAYRFLVQLNQGEVHFDEEAQKKLQTITQWHIHLDGEKLPMLTDDEIDHLNIPHGTLNPEERETIERHAIDTIELLESIHFPDPYSRIPEIAGGHHEKLNGQGYPRGLSAEAIALETRILAVADIFEALTASDRPYRRPNTLSQAMDALKRMSDENELDKNICRLIYEKEVYLAYGNKHLGRQQIDAVEMNWIKN